MKHILVVAAHAITRVGYQSLLQQGTTDISVQCIGMVTDLPEFVGRQNIALVILDRPIVRAADIRLVKTLTGEHPTMRILIASAFADKKCARQLLSAGATGLISTLEPTTVLVAAVHSLLGGRKPAKPRFGATAGPADRNKPAGAPCTKLSRREFEVFGKVAAGQKISTIGADLGLSTKTVSTYRGRILAKMGFRSNAEITRYALVNGIIA